MMVLMLETCQGSKSDVFIERARSSAVCPLRALTIEGNAEL